MTIIQVATQSTFTKDGGGRDRKPTVLDIEELADFAVAAVGNRVAF